MYHHDRDPRTMVGFNMIIASWLARHAAARNLATEQEDWEAGGSRAQSIWCTHP